MSEGRLYLGNRRYSSWSMRGWLAVRLAAHYAAGLKVARWLEGRPEVAHWRLALIKRHMHPLRPAEAHVQQRGRTARGRRRVLGA